MKVIFLDFDGVITIPPKWHLNPDKIKWIKKIVDETGAKIVVSSSWRCNTVEATKEIILDRPKRCPQNDMLQWLVDNLYDVTYTYKSPRGEEIKDWLEEHNDIENYVIIDDDGDMLDEQLYHFVQTNYEHGIGESEAIYAIKILNGLYIFNKLGLNFRLRYEWLKKCNDLPNKSDELFDKYNDLKQDFKNRYEH
jgi:hypothetical protein